MRREGLKPDEYLSDKQLRRLRQHVKDKADLARQRGSMRAIVDELIVEILVNTGFRASELIDLNIGDLPVSHGKDSVWIRNGKGNVARAVDIPESLRKRIERFVKLYRKKAGPEEPLFASGKGKRMLYLSLYQKIRKIGRQAGIDGLHPHMLRHTYATRLYNVEQDLRFVQDQLGHADPSTTAIYAKVDNKARKRQLRKLESLESETETETKSED